MSLKMVSHSSFVIFLLAMSKAEHQRASPKLDKAEEKPWTQFPGCKSFEDPL
jgi:hypothetical protein